MLFYFKKYHITFYINYLIQLLFYKVIVFAVLLFVGCCWEGSSALFYVYACRYACRYVSALFFVDACMYCFCSVLCRCLYVSLYVLLLLCFVCKFVCIASALFCARCLYVNLYVLLLLCPVKFVCKFVCMLVSWVGLLLAWSYDFE